MSRETLLHLIGNRLRGGRRGGSDNLRRDAVQSRLERTPRGLLPARAAKPRAALIEDFKRRLGDQLAIVEELANPALVPAAVARILDAARLPPRIRVGADAHLSSLPWETAPKISRLMGPAAPDDMTALSAALAGVAETGTLALASGPDNPVTLTFLPELHIVALAEDDIVAGLEDVWSIVARRLGKGQLPRTLNLVSAPSRTGDIGGRLVMGAHGPRQLVVLLLKSGQATAAS